MSGVVVVPRGVEAPSVTPRRYVVLVETPGGNLCVAAVEWDRLGRLAGWSFGAPRLELGAVDALQLFHAIGDDGFAVSLARVAE